MESGQRFDQPRATGMDEERRFYPGIDITQTLEDFSPAVDSVGVGGAKSDSVPAVLRGDGRAIALL